MSGHLPPGEHRRHVTIVFCDLSDSSALALELEPEEYSALLTELRVQAETLVARFGGEIVRIDGDGFIFLFGYPDAHSNAAQRAIEATLALHTAAEDISNTIAPAHLSVQLHSGIHSGVTLIRQGDLALGRYEILGTPTNVTARLCEFARAGEIVISERALGDNRARYQCSDRHDIRLRGQRDKLPVRKILGRDPSEDGDHGLTLFTGRTEEVSWLLDFLSQPAKSQGLGVIIGEAGMGKTRLLQHVIAQARSRRPGTYVATCEDLLGSWSLAPVQKLMRQFLASGAASDHQDLAPILTRLLSNEAAQITRADLSDLADAILDLLNRTAPATGVTFVIDDWHWVDELTETTIDLLVQRKRDLDLHILIASRHDPDPMFGGDQKHVLRLQPLDETSIRDLISELVDLPDPSVLNRIVSLSEGNPLFIGEFCHAANEGTDAFETAQNTSWLHALTSARFQRLSSDQATVVKSAAVIGFDVSRDVLQEVSAITLDSDLLSDLQAADFLFRTDDPERLKFKHGLTRQAIYNLIGLRERRSLHRKVIDIQQKLLSSQQQEEAHNRLAYHYSGANLPEKSLEHAMVGGAQALKAAALDRAQQLFAFALEEYKKIKTPPFGIERVLYQYGLASIVDPGMDQANRIDAIRDWSTKQGQPVAAAWAQYWRAFVLYGIGRPKQALQAFLAARDAGLSVGDQQLVSRITGTLGQVYAATSDYRVGIPALRHSITMQMKRYERSRNPAAPAYSTACLGFVLADQGAFESANQEFEKALALIAGSQHQSELSVRAYYGAAQIWQEQYDKAAESFSWIIEHASRMRSRYHIAMAKSLLGISEFLSGAAPHVLAPVRDIADSQQLASQQRMSLVHGLLTECYAQIGEWSLAKTYAVRTLQRSRLGDRLGDAQAYRSLALLAARGDVRKPASHYAQCAVDAATARASTREQARNRMILGDLVSALEHPQSSPA